jgi:hypothetical protein
MNIMPKHEPHAMVASFDSQYWQRDESDEIAAPQFGQLRVSACISVAQRALLQLNIPRVGVKRKMLDGLRASGALWSLNEMGCQSTKLKRVPKSSDYDADNWPEEWAAEEATARFL